MSGRWSEADVTVLNAHPTFRAMAALGGLYVPALKTGGVSTDQPHGVSGGGGGGSGGSVGGGGGAVGGSGGCGGGGGVGGLGLLWVPLAGAVAEGFEAAAGTSPFVRHSRSTEFPHEPSASLP